MIRLLVLLLPLLRATAGSTVTVQPDSFSEYYPWPKTSEFTVTIPCSVTDPNFYLQILQRDSTNREKPNTYVYMSFSSSQLIISCDWRLNLHTLPARHCGQDTESEYKIRWTSEEIVAAHQGQGIAQQDGRECPLEHDTWRLLYVSGSGSISVTYETDQG